MESTELRILINYKGHGYVFRSMLHPAQEDTLRLEIEESRQESQCGMNVKSHGCRESSSQETQHHLGHGKGMEGSQGRRVSVHVKAPK